MKYPLRVVKVKEREWAVGIADASGKIVCHVLDQEWGHRFAAFIVTAANRWHRLRSWFRPYTRDDWLWEKNTSQPEVLSRRATDVDYADGL